MAIRSSARIAYRSICLLLLCPAFSACFIQPQEEEPTVQLELAVELPSSRRIFSAGATPWDPQGVFHLEIFPKLVRIAVERADYELKTATWPDPEGGVITEEGPEGEVNVELKVPAGPGRRIRVLGFFKTQDQVLVYREEESQPLLFDLNPSQELPLTIKAVPHPVGSVQATVRCEEGNQAPWAPISVSLVDAKALVLYPPRDLVENTQGSLGVKLEGVPLGRPHWMRIILQNRTDGRSVFLDVRKPTFIVQPPAAADVAPDLLLVDSVLPCTF